MKEQGKPLEPGYMLQPQNSLNYGLALLSNPQPSILDLKCSIVMQILNESMRAIKVITICRNFQIVTL